MADAFAVAAASGSLRSSVRPDAQMPHEWSQAGVAIETHFTGAHLLHLATAACVLNDLYREAAAMECNWTASAWTPPETQVGRSE